MALAEKIELPPITVLGHDTPAKLFRQRCRMWADEPALRRKEKGIWYSVTWAGYYERARAIGLALADLGCRRGDAITILAENRPEWIYADMGGQCMGLVGNGIYPTSSPEQAEYILTNSGSRVVFAENDEQLDKLLLIRGRCPDLLKIIVMDLTGLRTFRDPQVMSFADFLARGMELAKTQSPAFEQAIDAGRAGDVAFLVYTSGTTGAPKGAMVSNRNLMFQISSVDQYISIKQGDKTLSFLPLCHIAERMATVFNHLAIGMIVHFPENSGTVFNDIKEVAPHLLFAPPRFWEKLYSQIELFMQDSIPLAQRFYRWAFAEGKAIAQAKIEGRDVDGLRRWRFRVLQVIVLANVRSFLGLQNVQNALTGAAPVPPDLLKWYMSIGIDLLEAYGMTESTGFSTATPPTRIKIGFAGVKALNTEIKLGPEDEVMIRGPNVFVGYWKMPEKTAETIDAEGWLHTGDCGELDADGYLRIKDRIKDIIITSGGKNITPSSIENQLKFSPYISDAVVIGDGRKFLSCLVMIDQDNVAKFAQDKQVPYTDFASLTRAPEVVALVKAEIEAVNAKLARVEQVKEFRLIQELLTAEDEELTPTMKLKRKVVARKYAPLIDEMYAG